ncbi:hypothetical protein NHX12_015302 [Muraenolepis orangiensis]|uniref:E3 ubiquitin-protein ligase TRIM32 n=1 Tax=Muraenolepis orangiensis TaxID=630683 RepID=A0A9Q0DDS0_9TELE|nr:hypothetical protein NHX12_015302 [Muraenolepis orangiensis]
MLMRSHSERRPLPGLSALLTHSTPKSRSTSSPPPPLCYTSESIFSTVSLSSQPHWVIQALENLEQGERELQALRERQQAEVEEVNRELDSAVFEAQREERRLLEKVEQEHREAQRRLDQVKRENGASVRVVQSLLDRQLCKMGQLKEQVHRWGGSAGGANKNQLQRGVAEVTQPWEISLSMKRVKFLPSPLATNFSLGEVEIREQGMTYPIGVCGIQGQKCALHSGEKTFINTTPAEVRKDPLPNVAGHRRTSVDVDKASGGSMRVVRKLRLSNSGETEGLKSSSSKSPTPKHYGASESSQDEEQESLRSDSPGHDLFLAFQPVSSQGESDDETDVTQEGSKKCQSRKSTLVLVPSDEPSCPPEDSCEESQASPNIKPRGSFSSHSALDLSPSHFPHATSTKKGSLVSSVDSGSPPSPDSEDSCYTYTVNTPCRGSFKDEHHQSTSTVDLSGQPRPLINGGKGERRILRKANRMRLSPESSSPEQNQGYCQESGRSSTISNERESRPPSPVKWGTGANPVSRSLSLSALEGDNFNRNQGEQSSNKCSKEKAVPQLREVEEESGLTALDTADFVRQFGKQGSGRTDFNLPSGVHATAKGQLFVVDCGNARIQVTDLQKNVVQQVTPSGTERSARICNYFDVAVNANGLIALTCAAERALLVFNRHGRLLQTFGGSTIGSTNEELEAPRGVTVTREDEFLVADMKRGSLTTLKLDPKTGIRLERTVVTRFHRPYLVAACITTGLMAVSERGNDTGRVPCIRVLEPGWNTIRILGVCSGLGPVLSSAWGLCIDGDGDVLVADWGKQHHRVLFYPATGVGWPLVVDNLSSPRGLALVPGGQVVVSDSMNHCVKIYRYK